MVDSKNDGFLGCSCNNKNERIFEPSPRGGIKTTKEIVIEAGQILLLNKVGILDKQWVSLDELKEVLNNSRCYVVNNKLSGNEAIDDVYNEFFSSPSKADEVKEYG